MVNMLIRLYVTGEISRVTLETSLKQIGFSSQIVDIHMKRADKRKAQDDNRSIGVQHSNEPYVTFD